MNTWFDPIGGVGALTIGEIHVWSLCKADLDESLVLYSVLSADERLCAKRLHRHADQVLYAGAHDALRCLLGAYVGLNPATLRFVRNEHGKPRLAGNEVAFSLSHSGDQIVIALSLTKVGVDVERIRTDVFTWRLAREVLSAEENNWLQAQGDVAPIAFFRLWTLKEAFLKADGRGLSLACTQIITNPQGTSAESPIAWGRQLWIGQELPAAPGYCSAVVSAGHSTIRRFEIRKFL